MGKRLNFWYGSIFGTYWMIYGIVSSFASVFLLAKGYANVQIGMTLAAANILAVVLQPLTADLADRSAKVGVIGIASAMTVMMMVFTLGLFVFPGGGLALCVIFVLLIAWHTVLQPMYNSLTFKLEESGVPVNFGIARSVGSLAYSLLVAVLGTLVEHMGIMVLPATAEITCAMMLISLAMTWKTFQKARQMNAAGEKTQLNKNEGEEEHETITMRQFVARNRLFFLLNIGVVGLFFSNSILNNYMVQIVTDVGGTSEDMGRILGLMAFLEIPTMVVFSRLKKRFSCQSLLKVASVGFTLKILLCWLADSVAMLFAAQAFQLVSFALFLPGMVYFTGEIMSKGEAVRGQALFTTMITVTTIFSSLLGGWVLDVSGAKTLTFAATLATAAGAALIFAVIDRIGKTDGR
ncbi:MAG: MFS transporter [Firmicutes bacterium]|nr:MFS transporter [Bacillota bacterium]